MWGLKCSAYRHTFLRPCGNQRLLKNAGNHILHAGNCPTCQDCELLRTKKVLDVFECWFIITDNGAKHMAQDFSQYLNDDRDTINNFLKENLDKGEIMNVKALYLGVHKLIQRKCSFNTFKVYFSTHFARGNYPDFESVLGLGGGYRRIRGRKPNREIVEPASKAKAKRVAPVETVAAEPAKRKARKPAEAPVEAPVEAPEQVEVQAQV